jgi:hypothetical protein
MAVHGRSNYVKLDQSIAQENHCTNGRTYINLAAIPHTSVKNNKRFILRFVMEWHNVPLAVGIVFIDQLL